MPSPMSILPTRPLQARPPLAAPWNPWTLLVAAGIVGFIVFSAGWVAPSVYTDAMIRNTAVPIVNGHLVEGSCTSKVFINICDLTVTAPGPAGRIFRSLHYVFGSFTLGNFTVRVVGDPAHPDWLTTDLGLDYFWDRVVSLALDVALMVALLWGTFTTIRRNARLRSWWHQASVVPVELTLLEKKTVGKVTTWTVQADDGTGTRWTMPKRAKPFMLGPDGRILGLMHTGEDARMLPLDSKLKWVKLSAPERAAALSAQVTA